MTDFIPEIDYFKNQESAPTEEISLRIGRLTIKVFTPKPFEFYVSECVRKFMADIGAPAFKVYVYNDFSRPHFVKPEDVENPTRVITDKSGNCTVSASRYCATLLDWQRREAHLVFASKAPDIAPLLTATLERLAVYIASPSDSAFIHGSAIVKDNKAIILFGPSGAGKSTTSHIACWLGGYRVLNDEIITLWLENGKPIAAGTPFGGTLCSNGNYPIKAFLNLSLSDKNLLEPLRKAQALNVLGASAQYGNLNFRINIEPVLDLLELALKNVPCYKLFLKPGEGFLNLLERL